MTGRDALLIAGIYRVNQVLTQSSMYFSATAYDQRTDDIVGLYAIEAPLQVSREDLLQQFQGLDLRKRVRSAHVLRMRDWGVEGARVYIACDPLRGVTLRHLMGTEDLPLPRSIELAQQLLQGVQAFHEQRLFGLDLRPSLITVDTLDHLERVQIDDIGLRAYLKLLGYQTPEQAFDIAYLDTRYAPPEYIHEGAIGPGSDIYQVGLLLFEMVTGRPPFVGGNAAETGIMQRSAPLPPLQQYKHEVPIEFQQLLEQALAKRPEERFQSPLAMMRALDSLRPLAVSQPMQPRNLGLAYQRTQIPSVTGEMKANAPYTRDMPVISESMFLKNPLLTRKKVEITEVVAPEEPGVYAYLYVLRTDGEYDSLPLRDKSLIIGRLDPKRKIRPDLDLREYDSRMTVSRQHIRIRLDGELFYIEDLKSHNKTHLGELVLEPFKPILLRNGDRIRCGEVRMVFKIPGVREQVLFTKEL